MDNPVTRRITSAALAAVVALSAVPAAATIVTREESTANPRGWSAVAGMDPQAVREMARTLPVSEDATADQPWCDSDSQIETSLQNEFGERKITTNARDTALWGSDLMGTWTVVLERPDATSCIIASGVGFNDGESPQTYFVKVGLNS